MSYYFSESKDKILMKVDLFSFLEKFTYVLAVYCGDSNYLLRIEILHIAYFNVSRKS